MARRDKREQDELRAAILCGEGVQIVLKQEHYYDGAKLGFRTRPVVELRVKGKNGQWYKDPEMVCLNRVDADVDDAASLLYDVTRWLEAGRDTAKADGSQPTV